jgi:alkylglycerol monooxygenase
LLSLPVFIFGVSVEIVFIYAAVSGMYDLFLHSKINLIPKWARLFMIDTLTHYIHHSKNKDHYNSNFGNMFVIWDKLFKTYVKPKDNEKVVIGIPNNNYNTGNYFQEIYLVIIRWVNSLKDQKLI